MLKLAANLSFLFLDRPLVERIAAAGAAGFAGVEYQFPDDVGRDALRQAIDAAGVAQVLLNTPMGDMAAGDRGLACLPDRVGEFRDGVGRAIELATHLGCARVHLVAGRAPADGPERKAYDDTYRANVAWAADQLAPHGITALLEPINSKRDVPGFFLRDTGEARAIMRELGRRNVRLQFDAYHVQVTEGDLVHTFRACLPDVGHIQIANPPGRNEPDRGEIDYRFFLDEVASSGYDGWVAAEYKPSGQTEAGLGWLNSWGLRRP
jgi:hydroxypyruvate isomerase